MLNDETLRVLLLMIAIICVTFLEAIALIMGINGTQLLVVMVLIAGIGGYEVRNVITKRKES